MNVCNFCEAFVGAFEKEYRNRSEELGVKCLNPKHTEELITQFLIENDSWLQSDEFFRA